MQHRNSPLAPEVWPNDLFSSMAVQQSAVIRPRARDIERLTGMDLFMRKLHRRGYRVAENSGQFIIFGNRTPIRWLTSPPAKLFSRANLRSRFHGAPSNFAATASLECASLHHVLPPRRNFRRFVL